MDYIPRRGSCQHQLLQSQTKPTFQSTMRSLMGCLVKKRKVVGCPKFSPFKYSLLFIEHLCTTNSYLSRNSKIIKMTLINLVIPLNI